jgi:hypothetical protein
VNVTVTQASVAGHLRLWEQGSLMPPTSAINFKATRARANNAQVTLSPTGSISTFLGTATGTAHFILDVVGYWQ